MPALTEAERKAFANDVRYRAATEKLAKSRLRVAEVRKKQADLESRLRGNLDSRQRQSIQTEISTVSAEIHEAAGAERIAEEEVVKVVKERRLREPIIVP
jgi:hypothetical protein